MREAQGKTRWPTYWWSVLPLPPLRPQLSSTDCGCQPSEELFLRPTFLPFSIIDCAHLRFRRGNIIYYYLWHGGYQYLFVIHASGLTKWCEYNALYVIQIMYMSRYSPNDVWPIVVGIIYNGYSVHIFLFIVVPFFTLSYNFKLFINLVIFIIVTNVFCKWPVKRVLFFG